MLQKLIYIKVQNKVKQIYTAKSQVMVMQEGVRGRLWFQDERISEDFCEYW